VASAIFAGIVPGDFRLTVSERASYARAPKLSLRYPFAREEAAEEVLCCVSSVVAAHSAVTALFSAANRSQGSA
jgi:hypothetical protein